MDGEINFRTFLKKKVYITTRGGRYYSGIVVKVDDNSKILKFIWIIDKFGKPLTLAEGEIASIEEERK